MLRERQRRAEILCCQKHAQGQTQDPGLLTLIVVLRRSGLSCTREDKAFEWARNKLGPGTRQEQHLVLCEAARCPWGSVLCWHTCADLGRGLYGTTQTQNSGSPPQSHCIKPHRRFPPPCYPAEPLPALYTQVTSQGQHSKYETSTPKSLHLENLS